MKCKSLDGERKRKEKQTVSKENESGKQSVSYLQIAGLLALLANCFDSLWVDRFILDSTFFLLTTFLFLFCPPSPYAIEKKNILSLFLSPCDIFIAASLTSAPSVHFITASLLAYCVIAKMQL